MEQVFLHTCRYLASQQHLSGIQVGAGACRGSHKKSASLVTKLSLNLSVTNKEFLSGGLRRDMLNLVADPPRSDAPAELCCPISGELLRDPVILVETGQTYVSLTDPIVT